MPFCELWKEKVNVMVSNENDNERKETIKAISDDGYEETRRRSKVTVEDPDATLVEHLDDLRGMLIKSAVVFVFFFMLIFLTIQYWFPYLSKGHDLIVRGSFEVNRFDIRTAGALGLGIRLPFICRLLWQIMKPGLVDQETKFVNSYFPLMFLILLGGLSFGYFVVLLNCYYFLIQMGE